MPTVAEQEAARLQSKVYLGDGVYASFDGYQVWVETENYHLKTIIALEPKVMEALIEYAKGKVIPK